MKKTSDRSQSLNKEFQKYERSARRASDYFLKVFEELCRQRGQADRVYRGLLRIEKKLKLVR